MSKGVTGPLLITAAVVAVGNGWIVAAWTWAYNASHGISTGAAASTAPPAATTNLGNAGGAIAGRVSGLPS